MNIVGNGCENMAENDVIKKVLDYIEDNLEADLSLEAVADKVGYSKFHLSRVFAEHMGCTLYKYIQSRRLTIAAEKLATTEKPIIQIADEAHYSSQQAFTFAFKQLYQCTPQRYRALRIHAQKPSRFTIEDGFTTLSRFSSKCEAKAA